MKDNKFDTITIGGGAAGMMAAISAKRSNPDQTVALVDRTFALGRKILVCGAGRCNITNVNLADSPTQRYYGADSRFIKAVFDQFGYQDIVNFFNELGVELYEEKKTNIGKVFPVTNQAQSIRDMLEDEIMRLGVKIILDTDVQSIKRSDGGFTLYTSSSSTDKSNEIQELTTKRLILSAGGKTYPALGSNGSGYTLAETLGHKIVTPVPSALPLVAKNKLSHLLQGNKVESEVTAMIDGKSVRTSTDEVMFTKYGLSGPAILNISREISIHINREQKNKAEVVLNFLPGKTHQEVGELLEIRWAKRPKQTVLKSLYGLFSTKVAQAIAQVTGIDAKKTSEQLNDGEINQLIDNLTKYRIKIEATRGWNEAEFTAGGVDTSEIDPKTLESKLVPNLYLCGEILNVDGDVGGYNLSWAWASGSVAGKLTH